MGYFVEVNDNIQQVNTHMALTTSSVLEQQEFITLIDHDVGAVTKSAYMVEMTVEAVAEIAQQTEEQTQNLYAGVNILSRQNQALDLRVTNFIERLKGTPKRASKFFGYKSKEAETPNT